jgi:hypothetical protein
MIHQNTPFAVAINHNFQIALLQIKNYEIYSFR